MPTRSSKVKDHDFTTIARRVVEQAIGEKLDGTPLDGRAATERLARARVALHNSLCYSGNVVSLVVSRVT